MSATTTAPGGVLAIGSNPRLTAEAENLWWEAAGRVWRNPFGKIGFVVLLGVIICAVFAPILAPVGPYTQLAGQELQGPSWSHPFGTDELGRDLLSRLMFGARISLVTGLVSVALGGAIGITTGLAAGYWGGWVESVVMRVWDTTLAFPAILLGIAVATVLGPGVINAAVAVGIISMPQFARISRASMLGERQKEYVTAARAAGSPDAEIVFRHVLPNIASVLLIQMTLAMAYAVLLEASLSFLGLGARPPEPSWGAILSSSKNFIRDNPWYGIFPGLALSALLLGLNFLADAIRDALDPRQKHLI